MSADSLLNLVYMDKRAGWQPGQELSDKIRGFLGVRSNQQFRKLLQGNATSLAGVNQLLAERQIGGVSRIDSERLPPNPYLFASVESEATPPGYETSDLKVSYLQKVRAAASAKSIMLSHDQVAGRFKKPPQ